MCGIAGLVAAKAQEAALRESLDALAHRGPDGEGQAQVDDVWLGQRRLAIIDLSSDGAQPMYLEGAGTIVFNGEIYNHEDLRLRYALPCRTRSDTEVLLRGFSRHGAAFLADVQGMYAFAWLSPAGDELALARDHAGMKPLWLWCGERELAFSSELRALAPLMRACGLSPRPSLDAIAGYLAFGSVQEPRSLLRDVEAVPPDEIWRFALRHPARPLRRERVDRWRGVAPIPAARAAEEAVAAVRAAVQRHLVSDRPVALFLSGGLDSNVLASELGREPAADVHAISVRLGSLGTEDEPDLVRRVARRRGLTLHEVEVSDLDRQFDAALAAYDQPSVDGLNTFLISSVARRLGYAVALSGVGADEVFGGYAHLRNAPGHLEYLAGAIPGGVLRGLLASSRPPLRRAALVLLGRRAGEARTRSFRRMLDDTEIRRLLRGAAPAASADQGDSRGEDVLALERRTYLRDTLLRDIDVMSMAHGLEIRAPYLDPEVLGVGLGIGSAALLDPSRPPKWVLREGWSNELDPGVLRRGKSGFTLALADILARRRAWLQDHLESLAARPWIDDRSIRSLVGAAAPRGHPAAWTRLLLLAQLEVHLRRWGDP